MTKDEALRLALEALEYYHSFEDYFRTPASTTISAIKAALEVKDEPVAWMCADESLINKGYARFSHVCMGEWKIPVYTIPPQRTWVGLTNDEVNDFAAGCHLGNSVQGAIYKAEAKLKEKNT